jgi:hypothetical protein
LRTALAILAVLLVALGGLSVVPAGAQPVFGSVAGPAAVGPGLPGVYNVTITGGPTGIVNYTVEYFLRAEDLTGGAPREESPGRTSGSQTSFTVDVTAPEKEQTVTLVVRISARSGTVVENTTVERPIVVIAPVVLRATFRNAAPTAALNVSVRFYVDDGLVGTQTIARIDPTGQATASYDYLPLGLAPGPHRVRIEADVDRDGRIDPARGELVVTDLFYRETATLSEGWSLILGVFVFVAAFFLTVAFRRRKAMG